MELKTEDMSNNVCTGSWDECVKDGAILSGSALPIENARLKESSRRGNGLMRISQALTSTLFSHGLL